jgi:plastocyanin
MRIAILLVPLAMVACGGGGGGGNQAPARINLSATSAAPIGFTIPSGGQIDFVNQDTVAHQIASADCPELASPQIAPGATFSTTVTGGPKGCTFTDTAGSHTFTGSFNVAPAGTPGNGY